jgi:hypothetical protein
MPFGGGITACRNGNHEARSKVVSYIRYRLLILVVMGSMTHATPVSACSGPNSHRSILLKYPPVRAPHGAFVLRVQVDIIPANAGQNPWEGVEARALEQIDGWSDGTSPLSIRIEPSLWSSCSKWGIVGQPAFVVGHLRWNKSGQVVFEPQGYRGKMFRTPEEDGIVASNMKLKRKTKHD